jgi:hypothetical protein
MLVIPAHGRLKKEDCEFETSVGYIVRLCLKKKYWPTNFGYSNLDF